MTRPTVPPALTRRRLLEGSAAVAASSLLSGCTTLSTPYTAPGSTSTPTNPQPTPPGTITPITVTVTIPPASSGSLSASSFIGLSYEKSALYEPLFTASNTNLIALFKLLGANVLRIGGNSVDRNIWTPNGAGQTAGQIAPSDVDACAAFIKATGWQVIYGINLGGSANGTQTTTLAAAEVAYAASKFGNALIGIEIGNEPDLYSTNYYTSGFTLSQFETLWGQYRTAIRNTTPTAPITGPATAGNESSWTVPFGQTVTKTQISLLTQHYYRANGQLPTSTAAFLVTPDSTLISDLKTLNTGATAIGVPFRMSECNSFYNGGASGVSNSYASALWVLDYMYNCAQGGASGVNFHGGGDGTGYTPIADNNGAVVEARPEFYGITFFSLAGGGELATTTISGAGTVNVTAYAIKAVTGTGLNLVLINKDSTANLEATLVLPQTVKTATLLAMTQLTAGAIGPSLTATEGVTIQGATINPDGTFKPAAAYNLSHTTTSVTCYISALSAVLVQLT
jgi:hypothetical protein